MNFRPFCIILTTTGICILSVLKSTSGVSCYDCAFDKDDSSLQDKDCELDPPPEKYLKECPEPDETSCINITLLTPAGALQSISRGCADCSNKNGCSSSTQKDGLKVETCIYNHNPCKLYKNNETGVVSQYMNGSNPKETNSQSTTLMPNGILPVFTRVNIQIILLITGIFNHFC